MTDRMTMERTLPRWDMSPIFPSLESEAFAQAFDSAVQGIQTLAVLFEKQDVRRRDHPNVDAAFVQMYETVTSQMNTLLEQIRVLSAYIGCFTTTDARNEIAKARESQLNTCTVQLDQLQTRYVAWVGSSDVDALLAASPVAREHAFPVQRMQTLARHQMSLEEEDLAAELRPSGLSGWARQQGNMSALLTATMPIEGKRKTLPISSVRALSTHAQRDVRRAAFEAELAAWESVSLPFAAALNGIKGYQQVLRRRRGYADDVEPTLTANNMDRQTLEAMQQACVESFPAFRRYLNAKARALGLKCLAWYDMNAPLGNAGKTWAWSDAEEFICDNFDRYAPRLADFAARAFQEQWIDAAPRVGKQGGAYCAALRPGESRVMMNYDGSFMSVSTIAHELGHAYHNLNLAQRTPLQRSTPMTLAETASIFCETLAFEAASARAAKDERLALLDASLQRDLGVVVDIHSRFLFERSVFEKRAVRDLTVSELNALMIDAQRQTYGDAVDPLHPMMWVVKGHYYGPTFYNYPYTFGLLFGLGLYAHCQKNPDRFRQEYDDFLSCTGLADAKTLAQRFGIDITRVDFWRTSLDVIRKQIDEFVSLI